MKRTELDGVVASILLLAIQNVAAAVALVWVLITLPKQEAWAESGASADQLESLTSSQALYGTVVGMVAFLIVYGVVFMISRSRNNVTWKWRYGTAPVPALIGAALATVLCVGAGPASTAIIFLILYFVIGVPFISIALCFLTRKELSGGSPN